MRCPSCAAEVPPGARFCPACGHAVHTMIDERRVTTVLFVDIVGFTRLSEGRDPEQVKHLVDRVLERMAVEVTSFGGHVDKVVGDGLLALFGAPVAHEDDAERAVRAALGMQVALDELAGELGTELQLRVGVNTGEVLVGALRAGGEYTAMGDVVNIASRLQTMAAPGQVVVGPETHSATAETFRYEPLGDLHPRGREQTVRAWTAIEAVAAPGNRPRHLGIPLIGRDAELGLLTSAVRTAVDRRRPVLLLVTGEAGVGKSRLAAEMIRYSIDELGMRDLIGRSLPYGQTSPWWAVAEILRAACGIVDDDAGSARAKTFDAAAIALGQPVDAAEVARVAEGILYLLGVDGRLADIEPARAREEAISATRTFLHGMAEHEPLLVVFSDSQWADDLVLDLIGRLLEGVGRTPLVVLVTARTGLEERWRPAPEGVNKIEVTLDPLSEESAGALLVAILGSDPGPELRRELVDRAGGNALFVEEMAALLKEGGSLPPVSFGSLPANLRGLIAARLDALTPDERAVVDDLAVLGRKGAIAAVVALAEGRASASNVQRAIRDLARRDVLEIDDDTCGFVTDLLREVAYSTMARAERARRHVLLAWWLQDEAARLDRSDEGLEEVAHHWATAAELVADLGDELDGVPDNVRESALVALQAAAERADDRELHRASARLFARMLGLLGTESGGARRHALVGRARANAALHDNEAASVDLDLVEAEAEAVGDEVALARALTVRGDVLRHQGELDDSIVVLGRAAALWRSIGDRRGEAAALRRLGWTYVHAGDFDRAEPPIAEALAAYRATGARSGQAWALQNLATISLQQGHTALAEERLRTSIELFDDLGDHTRASWARGLLAVVLQASGRTADAAALVDRITSEEGADADAVSSGSLNVTLGLVRLRQGRMAGAIELLTKADEEFKAAGSTWGRARALGYLAQALRHSGQIEAAAGVVAQAAELATTLSESSSDSILGRVLAAEHGVDLGDPGAALDLGGSSARWLGRSRVRALALAQDGRAGEAIDELASVAEEQPGYKGLLALVLAVAGRYDEAVATVEVVRSLGAAEYLDLVYAELAAALTASADDDREAVRGALRHAELLLDDTDDRLSQALVGLARAALLGDPDGEDALAELGASADGWRTMFARESWAPTAAS